MNPRILKEIRLLFWPWCLVLAAALMPVVSDVLRHFRELSSFIWGFGWFGGIPFLAALSLGGEFQQRTFPLLLGQPVERERIWGEKQVVLLLALAVVLPVFWLCAPHPSDLTGDVLGLAGA